MLWWVWIFECFCYRMYIIILYLYMNVVPFLIIFFLKYIFFLVQNIWILYFLFYYNTLLKNERHKLMKLVNTIALRLISFISYICSCAILVSDRFDILLMRNVSTRVLSVLVQEKVYLLLIILSCVCRKVQASNFHIGCCL